MSKRNQSHRTHRRKQRQDRRLRIRSIRRNPPDFQKLAGALIELAQAQVEADAEAEHALRKARQGRRAERDQEGLSVDEATSDADHPTGGPA